MEEALINALYTVLTGDEALAVLLASHRGAPAIFTGSRAPANAPSPYVFIGGAVYQVDDDAFGGTPQGRRRDLEFDIRTWEENRSVESCVMRASERIRQIIHRHPEVFAIPPYRVIRVTTIGPSQLPADDGWAGRLIRARFHCAEGQ